MSAGRIRSIKPETLDDEVAVALSDGAWRMWMSLRCVADDFGNCRFGERYLAATVWQDTARDIAKERDELVVAGKAKAYTVADQRYCHLEGWELEQRIDNAGKPRVPGPDDPAATGIQILAPRFAETRGEPPRTSETRGGSRLARARSDPDLDLDLDLDPEHRPHATEQNASSPAAEVWSFYRTVLKKWRKHTRTVDLGDRDCREIKARLKAGYTVDDLQLAILGLFASGWHRDNDRLGLTYALREASIAGFIDVGRRERSIAPASPAVSVSPLRDVGPSQLAVSAVAPGSRADANAVLSERGDAHVYPEFDWSALSRRKESKPS